MILSVFVDGEPKAQPRPRACRRGNHSDVYDPGTADEWKWRVGMMTKQTATSYWEPTNDPIALRVRFYLPRPKKHFYTTKKRFGELRDDAPRFCTTKPDIDNYVKAVMDAITQTHAVWKDDSQVAGIFACKIYADTARIGAEIQIRTLGD